MATLAASRQGQELLDWLLLVARRYPREDAIETFLQNVRMNQISKRAVNWAFGRVAADGAAFSVISEAMTALDRTHPPHWHSSEGNAPSESLTGG